MQPFEIIWQAPEFEYRPKGISWYWLSVIIAVLILGFTVWQRNFLFSIFIIVAEVLVLVWSNRVPPILEFALTNERLAIQSRTKYPLRDIEHFSVDPDDETVWPVIALRFHRRFRPPLHVRVPKHLLGDIRAHLASITPEAPWEESLADVLERFFRF